MDGSPRSVSGRPQTPPEFATLRLDRRHFLVLLGGAAAATALGPNLAWAGRPVQRRVALQRWTLPETVPRDPLDASRALIGAAILAPSHWNAQPWRFEADAGELRMTLDPSRTMPASDPDLRFSMQSLGAALENLLVAARGWGLQPAVHYLPWGTAARAGAPLVAARITWTTGEQRRDRVLFGALGERRTNPHHFDGRAVAMQSRAQLLAQVPDDLNLHWLEDRSDIRRVAAIVGDATLARARDTRSQAERTRWLRFSDDDARRSGDGMTPERLGLSGPLGWLAARGLEPGSHMHGWATGSWAHEVEDIVRSSGAVALLTAPKRQDTSALVAGQAYERIALKATTLGIAQQPLSAPIESEHHRALLARTFGAAGEEPMLLVRFGHAHAPDATPRRAVALVSTYRNS